jgi:ParB-like chromosome segregation protein Spo0J
LKFPPLSEKDRAGLKLDIQQNGQLAAIVINRADQILDGVHRFEICQELALEPKIVQLADLLGDKFGQVSEIEFIFSANYHRRQTVSACSLVNLVGIVYPRNITVRHCHPYSRSSLYE